ncbi:alpha/beta hydrolase family protein [Roseateles albus]|uniref:Dienelactone hydrolase n=1 Tax=Roseateles albus TaxID=2987525 RepID=A0ABT5K8D0_9BURK|nr:dienelactone hydrolase [Roseateles albus]MDC8770214.1 dienelactone hydrolase [Roseateles albus]
MKLLDVVKLKCLGVSLGLGLIQLPALANMGMTEIAVPAGPVAAELAGPVTLFYPTLAPEQTLAFGRMSMRVAAGAAPLPGNGRLVLISHGSGGSPIVHSDLARALVEAGFVVAMPEHRADNYKDPSRPGPDSWKLRPAEMSRAIDAVAADARFAPWLKLDKVGAYGMSAGGHTVLSLAGGRWSPAGFRAHCEAHLEADFQACVGLTTQLNGGWLDGLKQWLARQVIAVKFADAQPQAYSDPRIAAVVAAVPAAADFDMSSFARPLIPLALVTARQDRWLHPLWHSDAVLKACGGEFERPQADDLRRPSPEGIKKGRGGPSLSCEWLADLPQAGHGALLSPLPPDLSGLLGELLNDPPGFERASLPALDRLIADFFMRHLF